MFFCRSDASSCLALKQILTSYEVVSGQQINCQKSTLTFSSKTPLTTKTSAKQILNITQEGGNGKYLGLPELFGRRKRDLFTSIVDRIRQRGISWSNNFLSTAGKATLLKSVLASIPIYTMSCFKLPRSLCNRIQSALVRFWWDAKPGQRKMSWMSWEKLTIPTKDGGLGFRDIEACNDALLAKLSWRIFTNPSSLLAKLLMAKYCKHSSFLQCQATGSISHGWRSILIGRDLFKQGLGKNIGQGKDTLIWDDQWLSTTRPLQAMGPAPLDSASLTVYTLITPDSKQWDINKVQQVLPHHVEDVLQIIPGRFGGPDRDCWLHTASGCYTSKSGYHLARELKQQTSFPIDLQNFSWKNQVWNLPISQKLKYFLWKALHDILPTNKALSNRSIPVESSCRRCGEQESVFHIFFSCPLAQEVWNIVPLVPEMTFTTDMSLVEIFPRLKRCIALPPTGITMEPLYPWILWYLWLARNELHFSSTTSPAASVMEKATRAAKEWQAAQENPIPIPPLRNQITHTIQAHHHCYVDAAWKADNKLAGFGWEMRTSDNISVRQNSSTRLHTPSALAAEALALLSALQDLLDLGWLSVKVFSDSQQLIKLVSSSEWRSEIYGVLQDIRIISSAFHVLSFSYVARTHNSVADGIAKGALHSLAEHS